MDSNFLETNGYKLIDTIVLDKFKAVYKCKHIETNEDFVIKRYHWEGDQQTYKAILKEREIWQQLKHSNIVELLRKIESPFEKNKVNYYQVMEMCRCDLSEWYYEQLNRSLETCDRMIKEIISGLSYLHSNKVMHRDLKPQNILISFDGICKISDFDITTIVTTNITASHTGGIGSLFYSAPEQINPNSRNKYKLKVDIYSLGIIIMEFFTHFKNPNENMDIVSELRNSLTINEKFFENFGKIEHNMYYKKVKKMIKTMVSKDPKRRPDIKELSETFNNMNYQSLRVTNDLIENWQLESYKFSNHSLYLPKSTPKYLNEFKEVNIENTNSAKLGKGRYSDVYKVEHKMDAKYYAIKKVLIEKYINDGFNEEHVIQENINKILRRIEIWQKLKTDFVVQYKSVWFECIDSLSPQLPVLHIQTELCEMSLKNAFVTINRELNQHNETDLTPVGTYIATQLFVDVVEGVHYLHTQSPPIIHGNIKMSNILLTSEANKRLVKITDLGLTVTEVPPIGILRRLVKRTNNNEIEDIYCLGLLLRDMLNINHERYERFEFFGDFNLIT